MRTAPVCIVIGVGPGLGLALCRAYAAAGYAVGMVARRAEALAGYAASLPASAKIAQAAADVADVPALLGALQSLQRELGPVQTLVYNAANLQPGLALETTPERFAADFQINCVGFLAAAQAAVAPMRQQGGGFIFYTSGAFAVNPSPKFSSLAASKAAGRNLCVSLDKELRTSQIRVASVTVGGFIAPNTPHDPDRIAAAYLKAAGNPAEWQPEISSY